MNNKEFIAALAQRTGFKADDTQNMMRTAVHAIVGSLAEARFSIPPDIYVAAMSFLPAEMLRINEALDARLGR